MNQLKKLIFMFAAVCLLLILVPSVSYAYTTTNLIYDSTGANPNGYNTSNSSTSFNGWWYIHPQKLNRSWQSCFSIKVGFTITAGTPNPELGEYVVYVNDGNKWIKSNETFNVARTGVEYIFEPAFKSTDIKEIAICPLNPTYTNRSVDGILTVYSITQGQAKQAAVIDDFDFTIENNKTINFGTSNRKYSYERTIHFYDISILEINKKYYLKSKYKVEGSSYICEFTNSYLYYFDGYAQSSTANLIINGNILLSSNYTSDVDENFYMSSPTGVSQNWYYPDGADVFIALGSTKPTSIVYQSVNKGSCGQFVIDENIVEIRKNFNINSSPEIKAIGNPTPNKIYSEADTNLAPVISVSDIDNQSLTCKYFIDNETAPRDTKTVTNSATQQTVSFAGFNAGALSDGIHIIRFEIYDGKDTTKVSRSIKVDRRAPIINKLVIDATANSITVRGLAADTICSSDSLVYNVNISSSADGGTNSVYTSSNVYTQNGLVPGTKYYISFKVRDAYGHIGSYQGVAYTKK